MLAKSHHPLGFQSETVQLDWTVSKGFSCPVVCGFVASAEGNGPLE